ncbi:MAG: 5-formyltetrahydrofolate cyclo-ligase [bacterium]|nr:5-formyltetrahydrofolate cyclo-ligase [bacterium]
MQQAKARLRQRLLSERATLTAAEVQHKSAKIAAGVSGLSTFQASHTIMVYLALAQEVQTSGIIDAARHHNKRIVVPVVEGGNLVALELPLESAQLRRGRLGILEPSLDGTIVQPDDIPLIVVPGIAFDRQGGRLGFGKGYYDRFLQQMPPTAYAYGLAFAMQIVPRVPQMAHDICVHSIMTEQEFIPCQDHATS